MIIHDGTITLIDRVALSNDLMTTAEALADEATLWTARVPAELQRSARTLAEIGRQVLSGRADFAKAEAFYEAGQQQLQRAISSRRFLTTLETPPNRKGSDHDHA